MKARQLKVGPMDNFSYLLWDGGKAAVIDPAWQPQKLADAAAEEKAEITCVLLTHAHPDHVNGVSFFTKNFPSVPVYLHEGDNFMLENSPPALRSLKPGEPIAELPAVTAIHTPGHTPGSVCFLAGSFLFTGDTLFIGECGRVDLPGSSPEALYDSFVKLAWLKDDLTVYPGHSYNGDSSTLRVQKEYNLYLKLAKQERRADFLKAVT
jgi:hydroxyacylglutathione hydrolase